MAGDPSLLRFDAETESAQRKLAELRASLRAIASALNTDQSRAELAKLEASLDDVEQDINEARAAAKRFGDSKEEIAGLEGAVARLSSGFGKFLALFGVTSIAAVGTAALKTAADFEQLRTRLETLTGSSEAAAAAFQLIQKFAATTPFSVQQITEAFAQLKAQGVEPTEDVLRSIGDTAAAMGKDITEFTGTLLAAQTGEFERLKAFGIIARTEGEKIRFTFRGTTTEVEKNAESIRKYLLSLGETDFAGAMERQSKTLNGAISNLKDNVASLADTFGRSGLSAEIAALAVSLSDAADSGGKAGSVVDGLGKTIAFVLGLLTPLGATIQFAFSGAVAAIEALVSGAALAGSKMVEFQARIAGALGLDELSARLRSAGRDAALFAEEMGNKAAENLRKAEDASRSIGTSFGDLIGRLKSAKEETKGLADATADATTQKLALSEAAKKELEAIEGTREAIREKTTALLEAIAAAEKDGVVTTEAQETIRKKLADLSADYKRLGAEIPEVLQQAIDKYGALGTSAEESEKKAKEAIEATTSALKEQVSELERRAKLTADAAKEADKGVSDAEKRRQQLLEKGPLSSDESEELTNIESELFKKRSEQAKASRDAADAALELEEAQAQLSVAIEGGTAAITDAMGPSADYARLEAEIAKQSKIIADAAGAQAEALGTTVAELERGVDAGGAFKGTMEEALAALNNWDSDVVAESIDGVGVRITNVGGAASEAAGEVDAAAGAMGDAIQPVADEAKKAADEIRRVGKESETASESVLASMEAQKVALNEIIELQQTIEANWIKIAEAAKAAAAEL